MDAFWNSFGVAVAAVIIVCCVAAFVAAFVKPETVRRHWLFFVAAIVVSLWAGVKPTVTFPKGIVDDDSCFDTNSWEWVEIRWKKIAEFPAEEPVEIEAAVAGQPETNWFKVADAMAGDLTNRISASVLSGNPTNFIYRMTSDYEPAVVEIRDFAAFALETNGMGVVCSWTCPTNLVGLVGQVQYRRRLGTNEHWNVAKTLRMQRHNEVTVTGNFVSGRIDREFRVVVDGYEPLSIRNRTSAQVFRWCLQRRIIGEEVLRTVTSPLRLGSPALERYCVENFKIGVWM